MGSQWKIWDKSDLIRFMCFKTSVCLPYGDRFYLAKLTKVLGGHDYSE